MWDFSACVLYSLRIPIKCEICYEEETVAMNYWMINIPWNFVVKWLFSLICTIFKCRIFIVVYHLIQTRGLKDNTINAVTILKIYLWKHKYKLSQLLSWYKPEHAINWIQYTSISVNGVTLIFTSRWFVTLFLIYMYHITSKNDNDTSNYLGQKTMT